MVKIGHVNGLITIYAHMNKYYVETGDPIYQGQIIGEVGNTGNSSAPHLHFEIREGAKQVDPMNYLP
jgi:murein DD-endopeptidase MepM/ murein hydrolase activator NlpD